MNAELMTLEDRLKIISALLTEYEITALRARDVDLNEAALHRLYIWGISDPHCSDDNVIKAFVAITLTLEKFPSSVDQASLIKDRAYIASILLERGLIQLPGKSNYFSYEI